MRLLQSLWDDTLGGPSPEKLNKVSNVFGNGRHARSHSCVDSSFSPTPDFDSSLDSRRRSLELPGSQQESKFYSEISSSGIRVAGQSHALERSTSLQITPSGNYGYYSKPGLAFSPRMSNHTGERNREKKVYDWYNPIATA
eukprot:TRINITY_DN166_c0_g1_i1.p1 TRINITY_DN166_c0_g1~~TRINITY_DN166_c0_g1_i1.p1  ORF type:complete len:141 (+),score=5.80 TRINITY_DN166_c0_g1_i1:264-686(+)